MAGDAQFAVAEGKYCWECGERIRMRAELCPKCGTRQQVVGSGGSPAVAGRSRVTAALFAIFLGGVGIHKFYLGRAGQGILYLLFFWTFIPALIGFIEGLVYLSMSDAAFAAKYG